MKPAKHLHLLPVVLLTMGAAACGKSEDPTAVRSAIEARNQEIGAAVARGDSGAIAALYTADAVLMPPNGPAQKGHDAIQALWKGFVESGIKGLKLTSIEVESHGAHADEEGMYEVLGADGKVADSGKYIVIWEQEGGKWFLHRDIWNSDNPPPPPPPPAAPPPPEAPAEPGH